jgi:hypothetical protein
MYYELERNQRIIYLYAGTLIQTITTFHPELKSN